MKSTKTQRPTRNTRTTAVFTDDERAAMRDYVREAKAAAQRGGRATPAEGESAALAALAAMPPADRALGERLHALIRRHAPELAPKTWYGMPAYAREGNVVCFFQCAHKFKTRYATLGFSDKAHLDEGRMWPTVYALQELTAAEEAKIVALLRQALA